MWILCTVKCFFYSLEIYSCLELMCHSTKICKYRIYLLPKGIFITIIFSLYRFFLFMFINFQRAKTKPFRFQYLSNYFFGSFFQYYFKNCINLQFCINLFH